MGTSRARAHAAGRNEGRRGGCALRLVPPAPRTGGAVAVAHDGWPMLEDHGRRADADLTGSEAAGGRWWNGSGSGARTRCSRRRSQPPVLVRTRREESPCSRQRPVRGCRPGWWYGKKLMSPRTTSEERRSPWCRLSSVRDAGRRGVCSLFGRRWPVVRLHEQQFAGGDHFLAVDRPCRTRPQLLDLLVHLVLRDPRALPVRGIGGVTPLVGQAVGARDVVVAG
jgi:hypothetical protein